MIPYDLEPEKLNLSHIVGGVVFERNFMMNEVDADGVKTPVDFTGYEAEWDFFVNNVVVFSAKSVDNRVLFGLPGAITLHLASTYTATLKKDSYLHRLKLKPSGGDWIAVAVGRADVS